MICHKETPGFDKPFSEIRVLERGEKYYFVDKQMNTSLKQSKVLGTSVKLDFNFNEAKQCIRDRKFFKGVCMECSKYHYIDDDNNIKPKKNYADFVKQCKESSNTNRQGSCEGENDIDSENGNIDFNVNEIAPYSDMNLMSTNIWNNEAYDSFVGTLTQAEKLVLTPVHMQVIIMRLRTNNIPFSCHGAIC